MAITVKKCRSCGKRYQYYQGAALPEQGLCSQCALGDVVLHNENLEYDELPS
ncbi:MAG: hypothetical protein Q8S19_09670 [Bacillota bacterium]|nr:hypothetical protein [Bacillota bacterium]